MLKGTQLNIDNKKKEQMKEIISLWGIQSVQEIEKIWESDVYTFVLPDGNKAVIKRICEANDENIRRHRFCHEVVRHLNAHNIPITVPISNAEDNTLVTHDGQLYIIIPYIQHERNKDSTDPVVLRRRLFNIGNSLALMHKALAEFPSENINEYVWQAPLSEEMINYRSQQLLGCLEGEELVRIESVLAALVPEMNKAFYGLPEQLIHRDCHYANILLHDDRVAAFIDNDHFSIGPRILDLGYFLNSLMKFHPEGFLEPEEWIDAVKPFLQGYCSQITLSRLETEALHYAIVSIPMQFVGWCYETGRNELGRSMLSAMEWMYEHIAELRSCVMDSIRSGEHDIDNEIIELGLDVRSALEYSKEDRIEEWVHKYCTTGKWANHGLSKGLKLIKRWWNGPLEIDILSLVRKVGPEQDRSYQVTKEYWDNRISMMSGSFKDLLSIPPLIAEYVEGELKLADGNTRCGTMEYLGWNKCWVIIWYNSEKDFIEHSKFLKQSGILS